MTDDAQPWVTEHYGFEPAPDDGTGRPREPDPVLRRAAQRGRGRRRRIVLAASVLGVVLASGSGAYAVTQAVQAPTQSVVDHVGPDHQHRDGR